MPTITALPSPPSTSDPANFSSKADAHILALQTFTTEVNAFGASLAGAGIITPTRDSVAATATTTDLWNNSIIQDWTGTPTITNFPAAPAVGSQRIAYPTVGTTITNNANIIVQGNANRTADAGEEWTITPITTTTFYVTIQRKDGLPVVPPKSMVRLNTANGYGSTNTKIRRFTTPVTNQGTDITYADSITLGASFTINTNGVYAISYTDNFNTASSTNGISLNSNQLTTNISGITVSNILAMNTAPTANFLAHCGATLYLNAGDVIRPHDEGTPVGTSPVIFTITRVS